MTMTAAAQAEFIGQHLGPALRRSGLADTEIFCWDHNCDQPDYALQILADTEARQYVAGSAWHLYGGDIAVLAQIQQAHPDKRLYFTEQWVGKDGQFAGDLRWHGLNVLLGALRNGCSVVLEWNLAADADHGPHTPGGEASCVGALTLAAGVIKRNVAYYVIAHAAGFVPPGSVRIASNDVGDSLRSVALATPAGGIVLLVCNGGKSFQPFAIHYRGLSAATGLDAGALATYVWAMR